MPAPNLPTPLEPLRVAVRRAVERSSMLATASSIGMSAPGLRNFLDGGTPRRSTFRKLAEWYVREAAATGTASDETAQAALAVLLNGVPNSVRQDAARIVLDAIRKAHEKHGAPLPDWFTSAQAKTC